MCKTVLTAQGGMCGKTASVGFGCRIGRLVVIALVNTGILTGEGVFGIDIAGELFSGNIQDGAYQSHPGRAGAYISGIN